MHTASPPSCLNLPGSGTRTMPRRARRSPHGCSSEHTDDARWHLAGSILLNRYQAAEELFWPARISMVRTYGTTGEYSPGCSKRPSSKAATSEEPRRYIPPFVWAVRPWNGSWRTEKPVSDSDV